MIECVTQFDDNTHISTQHESHSPFEYGENILIEKLPRHTSIRDLIARHCQRDETHKMRHPESVAMVAKDIAGMDRRWREGQRVKKLYRASIGYITDAELKRLLGGHYQHYGDKVRRQLALLAADRETIARNATS